MLLLYLGYMGKCRWTEYVFFWPRCPEQGIQFYSPLTKTGYGITSQEMLTLMRDGFLFRSSVQMQMTEI